MLQMHANSSFCFQLVTSGLAHICLLHSSNENHEALNKVALFLAYLVDKKLSAVILNHTLMLRQWLNSFSSYGSTKQQ